MSNPAHIVLSSRSVGQVTLDAAHRFLAWLGAVTLGLMDRISFMISQGNQEMAQMPASSQLGAPAILMAGGLVTLAILFAVMLVRKTPTAASSGPGASSRPEGKPTAHPATQGASTYQPEASAANGTDAASDPRTDPLSEDVPLVTAEVDDLDEEVTLALSTAGSLGSTEGTASQRRARANGRRHTAPRDGSRVMAVTDEQHQDLLKRGRQAGSSFDGNNLHALLEHMRETGIAEPRVLKTVPHLVRIRLIHCRGCSSGAATSAEGIARCPFEEGFLEGAFKQLEGENVVVREIACRQRGDPGCDFEVWF